MQEEMTEQKMIKGLVFDIKHFAVHDGPGIRTTVFLKGCPLRCFWCHNPESQKPHQEIMYYENLCIRCKECIKVCPEDAQTTEVDQKIRRELCKRCGTCVEACYAGALKMVGKYRSIEEVVKELEKDEIFYKNSGGGITISGGEPTMYPRFTLGLLKRCKESGYHTTLDTCGYVKWENLEQILRYVDLVLYDLKHMNSEKHREQTGVPNELIHENLKRMDEIDQTYIIRVPLIPECNDSKEDIEDMARFLSMLKNIKYIELLPYHQFGISKYGQLGIEYRLKDLRPLTPEHLDQIGKKMRRHGLNVVIESMVSAFS
jgi:pyruvate formate lyase activating enzyme